MDDRQLYRAAGAPGLKEALAVALVRKALATLGDQGAADAERAYARAVLADPTAAALRAALPVLVAGGDGDGGLALRTAQGGSAAVPLDDDTLALAVDAAWSALVAAS
jgi:hypothetical protein